MPYRVSQIFGQDLDRVKFAMNAAGIGVWEVDLANNRVIWDDRCCELIGLSDEHILPYDEAFRFIHPEDVEGVRAAIERALQGVNDGLFDATYRTIGADAKLRWVNFTGSAYMDDAGQAVRFGGVAREVTTEVTTRLKIKESEAFTKLLSDSVPAMIYYIDVEERYKSYNETFMQWHNVGPTEIVGMPIRDLIGDAAYARIQPHLAKAFEGARVAFETPSRISPNRWLSIVYTPHRAADGVVQGIIVHATDITQSKNTEIDLRQSEARFRILFEQAPIGTCLFVGREMRVEMANQRMLEIWGRPSSILGKALVVGVPELEGQPLLEILDRVFTTGQSYMGIGEEVKLVVNGTPGSYYYDYIYQPILNDAGEVYAIMDMTMDATERVLAERKAKESNAIIHDAVQLAALETWAIDIESGEFTLSQELRYWLGYGKRDAVRAEALFNRPVEQVIAEALAAPAGILDLSVAVADDAAGQARFLQVRGHVVYDEQGKAQKFHGMVMDVTLERNLRAALENEVQLRTEELQAINEELQATNEELYESNQSLRHSNEELSQYAYVASHDLQEPLRKIRFFCERVASSTELSDTNRALIERVIASAQRMTTLIQALLEFSRLQRSSSDPARRVDLNAVVKAVLDDFELSVFEKNARIVTGNLPTVEAAGLQMNQLFYNLVSNALKFTKPDESPVVTIDSWPIPHEEVAEYIHKPMPGVQYYHIAVSDNGIGFAQEFSEQIFEVFKRLHGKGIYPGSGIGLALCLRIVRNHGGALQAVGEPGKGATFHIILPGTQGIRSVV